MLTETALKVESVPVLKAIEIILIPDLSQADEYDMTFSGTLHKL
ncbi:hypothetical protein ACFLT8_03400 [Chloroflexota bacterium]